MGGNDISNILGLKRMKGVNERYNSTVSKSLSSYMGHAPLSIRAGKGARLWSEDGKCYLDCGMALGSVTLGYAHDDVDEAVIEAIRQGVNFSRPSWLERELTENLSTLFPFPILAQYSKSGSMLLSSLVRVCRYLSGKSLVAYPNGGAYLGNNDWYLAGTNQAGGIPEAIREHTVGFSTASVESLVQLFDAHGSQLACLIMEPYRVSRLSDEYYRTLRELCNRHQVYLVFDETISGFRFNYPLCQSQIGVWADFTILGKAMANGYAMAAAVAPEHLMQEVLYASQSENLYGFSNTHSGETVGLSAAIKTLQIYEENAVCQTIAAAGEQLLGSMSGCVRASGLQDVFRLQGQSGYFYMQTVDRQQDKRLREHFYRVFHDNGVLFRGTVALSLAHTAEQQRQILQVFDRACCSYPQA